MENKSEKKVNKNELMNRIEVKEEDISEVNHKILEVKEYEEQIMNAETKEIRRYIEARKKMISRYYSTTKKGKEILNKIAESEGMNIFAINKYLFEPLIKTSSCIKRYSEFEILMVLEFYQEQLIKINELTMYPPQLEQYCRLLGISTNIFKRDYVNSESDEMRNAAQQVIDYIASSLTYAGLTKKVDVQSQIFSQKSSLGRVEKSNDQQNENSNNIIIVSADDFEKAVQNITNQNNLIKN